MLSAGLRVAAQALAKMQARAFTLPPFLSADVAQLLSRMFEPDAARRATIAQIKCARVPAARLADLAPRQDAPLDRAAAVHATQPLGQRAGHLVLLRVLRAAVMARVVAIRTARCASAPAPHWPASPRHPRPSAPPRPAPAISPHARRRGPGPESLAARAERRRDRRGGQLAGCPAPALRQARRHGPSRRGRLARRSLPQAGQGHTDGVALALAGPGSADHPSARHAPPHAQARQARQELGHRRAAAARCAPRLAMHVANRPPARPTARLPALPLDLGLLMTAGAAVGGGRNLVRTSPKFQPERSLGQVRARAWCPARTRNCAL
jgi:hypothetical protein